MRIDRAAFLTVAITATACAAADEANEGADSADFTAVPSGAPTLRLPLEAGAVVLCQQGNDSGDGRSHSAAFSNTRYALDLSAPGRVDVPVVAPAAGRVVRIVTGAVPLSSAPGAGFGNQVAIEHAAGFITVSSHLARVDTAVGAVVRAGDHIGIMGETGQAGNVHIHFSMHRKLPPTGDGLGESVPMSLVAADVTAGEGFSVRASNALVCSPATVTHDGHLYASENGGGEPIVGPVPAALAGPIRENRAAVERGIDEEIGVQGILATAAGEPAARTVERLSAWVAAHPADLIARYWLVVFGLRVAPTDRERLRAELAHVEAAHPASPGWLWPWTVLRSAQVAVLEGRREEAQQKLDLAATFAEAQGAEYATLLASTRAAAAALP